MKIILALLIFSAVVLFHELGHFLLAKKNGIEVLEFSLGMGPRLFHIEKGGTVYSVKLFPLGGSCMMAGEDEDDDSPGSFHSAGVWGRFCVIAAGPVFNFILAFLFSLIIIGLVGYMPARIETVEEGSPAYESGLREGDLITEFDGYHIDISDDLNIYLSAVGMPQEEIQMKVKRDGQEMNISYEPQYQERYLLGFNRNTMEDEPLEVASLIQGLPMEKTGIQPGDRITAVNGTKIETNADYDHYMEEHSLSDQKAVEITYEHHGKEATVSVVPSSYKSVLLGFRYNLSREKGGVLNTVKYSLLEVKYWIRTTILSLKELILGKYSVKDLSGPVGVVNVIGDTYEQSKEEGTFWVWMNMLNMAILLSANLGVMNLLPIPALDGGRLIFILIEAIFRRPVNRRVEGMVHFAGFMLLMALMVFVMYNDIMRLL